MQLVLRTLRGNSRLLDVEPSQSIAELKVQVAALEGLPVDSFQLQSCSSLLNNGELTLSSASLSSLSTVSITVPLLGGSSALCKSVISVASKSCSVLASSSSAAAAFSTAAASTQYSDTATPLTLEQVRDALSSMPVQASARPPLLFRSLAVDERLPMWINNQEPILQTSRLYRRNVTESRSIWTETAYNYFTFFGQFGMVKTRVPLVAVFNPFTQEVELSPHPSAHAQQPVKRLRQHQEALLNAVRTKLDNTMNGCQYRYKRLMKLVGMGYRIASVAPHPDRADQRVVEFQLGRSHLIPYALPSSVQIKVLTKRGTVFRLLSTDYEAMQRVAMGIRHLKKPETYTGKGVVFWGETVVKKEGKKK